MTAGNYSYRIAFVTALIVALALASVPPKSWGLQMQNGNDLPLREVELRPPTTLPDNRLGGDYGSDFTSADDLIALGFKWIRMAFWDSALNWQNIALSHSIPPEVDEAVTGLSKNGIQIVLNLGVGSGKRRLDITRFKNPEEMYAYREYVRFMVRHFKDRIKYYEIWNEANIDGPWGDIALVDYLQLVRHVCPIIRQEYPDARITIGAIGGRWQSGFPGYGQHARYVLDIDYLKGMLLPDIMSQVDVISWHPFYGHRPDDPYWKDYPSLVGEIRNLASLNGFKGELLTEEMLWRTEATSDEPQSPVSATTSAKYLSRAIVMHLGLNVTACVSGALPGRCRDVVPRLADVLAGAQPASASVTVEYSQGRIRQFSLTLPSNDLLVVAWRDGIASDTDRGVEADLRINGTPPKGIMAIDVFERKTQELLFESYAGGTRIRGLLLRDYPIFLRFHLANASPACTTGWPEYR